MKLRLKLALLIIVSIVIILSVWVFVQAFNLRKESITSWYSPLKGDCALVLTGGPGRIRAGFDLLQRGDVRKLIISGVNPNVSLEDIFPQLSSYPSVQRFNVILENHSRTTYGNVKQSLPVLQKLKCKDILLVTSQIHMPRARRLFVKHSDNLNFIKYSVYMEPTRSHLFYEALKNVFYKIWF